MKTIALRLISSLRCSVRRLIQKSSARRLLPRSLMWPLRAMLLVLTSFFSFTSLLSSSPASALNKYDDATPTATFHPLFPTSTPIVGGLDCPAAPIVGWGTLTPNPQWQALCSRCAPTATLAPSATSAFPTFTPDGTLAYLTGTPTPATTFTPSPTATNTGNGDFTFIEAFVLHQGAYITDTQSLSCTAPIGATNLNYVSCVFDGSHYDDHNILNSIIRFHVRVKHDALDGLSPDPTYYWKISEVSSISGTLDPFINYEFTGTSSDLEGSMASAHVIDAALFNVDIVNKTLEDGGFFKGELSMHARIEISTNPIVSTPPTSTTTPMPEGSYCSVVDDSPDDSGFGLPIITGGTPVCGGAGGFIIPFSWFQLIGIELDDLIVPFIEVCFVPTSFGVLTIANNTIDLDVAAYILGALFLLSLVM
jgi:hypothetical protein